MSSHVCQNCRGLNSFEKRHNLFQYVRKKKYDIICLLNIHIEEKMENFVKNELGYQLYISSYTGNQRGVMVLINNTFEYELRRIKRPKMVILFL